MYDVDDNVSIFVNTGVQKPPIMDNVIYYDGGWFGPINEKFVSSERV